MPVPPASDTEYPAVTGPVELPPGAPLEGFNPTEVARAGGPLRRRRVEVPMRERPAGSTKEP